jgi:superfamily II DNA or RNA helicase
MTTPSLRPYQQTLADDVRSAYRQGYRCPLVVASTGAGKTVLFSYITYGAARLGNPVLITAHRKEIIKQISLSLARFGVEHQVIAAPQVVRSIKVAHFKAFGRSFVSTASTTMVGSVQTVVGRFDTIDATLARCPGKKLLIVMDEGHHVVEDTQWGKVMDRYYNDGGRALIVTASPERLDGRGLGAGHGGYADTMIEAPPMSWLIAEGFLSPYRIFTAAQKLDLTGVRTRMGDYVASDLEVRVDKPSVTGDAIQHYRRHADGMRAVVFCVSVSHSQHVAAEFQAAGIAAAHIDGSIDDSERDTAITDFADGRVLVLTQVNLVSEGFDLGSIAQKDVTIDCLIDLAPTESLVNAMQRWGRALRPRPGKTAIILDHAGNVFRHGLPDDERQWALEGRKKKKRAANDNDEQDVKITTCTQCFTIHRPAPECPTCGHVYPLKERKVEQHEGELVELAAEQLEALRRQKRAMQGQAQSIEQLVAQGISRPRAAKIIQAREAKAALVGEIVDALQACQQRTGMGPYQACGFTLADIKRMKPKELKELQAKLPALMTVAA